MDLKTIYKLAYNCTPFDGNMKNYGDFVTTMLVAPTLEKINNKEMDRFTFPEVYLYLLIKSGIGLDFMATNFHEAFKEMEILNETEDIEVENQDIDYDLYDICSANILFKEINEVGKISPTMFTTLTDYIYEKPINKYFDIFLFWQHLYDQGYDFGFEQKVNTPENGFDEANHKLLINFLDNAYSLSKTENEILFVNQFAKKFNLDIESIQLTILCELEECVNIKLNEIKAQFSSLFNTINLTSETPTKEVEDYPVSEEDVIEEKPLIKKTIERSQIKNKLSKLSSMVVGQEKATDEVASTILSASIFKQEKHPMASFILTGPTGVGKTETAKAIAQLLFNNNIVTVDMTQFQHPVDINRLTGTGQGYVGYGDKIPFLEFLKKNEPGVILFDEIEKAHTSCLTLLMRMLDEGEFIDAKGEVYDLSNMVIFCTTNATQGVSEMKGLGFNSTKASTSERLTEIAGIKPEIIGRFDSKIEYQKLNKDACKTIAIQLIEKEIKKFLNVKENKNIIINYTNGLINKIVEESNFELLGARDIKTNVRKYFNMPICNQVAKKENQSIIITLTGEKVKVENNTSI